MIDIDEFARPLKPLDRILLLSCGIDQYIQYLLLELEIRFQGVVLQQLLTDGLS